MAAAAVDKSTLVLFDVDGTLTPARKEVSAEMLEFLKELRSKVTVGFVGGSDLKKQEEQLGKDVLTMFDYCFSENGLVAYKDATLIGEANFAKHIGEDQLKRLINWVLAYLSKVDCPVKRGTFIEFRAGMLNISPVGRNCSQAERDAFEEYDKAAQVRPTMVAAMKEEFKDLGLTFSIGGQISFDVFPEGWDKRYALQFVEKDFQTIHFFGDKCFEGGNDFEIFTDPRTLGHETTSPEHTMEQCKALFFK